MLDLQVRVWPHSPAAPEQPEPWALCPCCGDPERGRWWHGVYLEADGIWHCGLLARAKQL